MSESAIGDTLFYALVFCPSAIAAVVFSQAVQRGWTVQSDRPLTWALVLCLPEIFLFLPFLMALMLLGLTAPHA